MIPCEAVLLQRQPYIKSGAVSVIPPQAVLLPREPYTKFGRVMEVLLEAVVVYYLSSAKTRRFTQCWVRVQCVQPFPQTYMYTVIHTRAVLHATLAAALRLWGFQH